MLHFQKLQYIPKDCAKLQSESELKKKLVHHCALRLVSLMEKQTFDDSSMKSSKYLSANIFAKLSKNWNFLYHFKALDSTMNFIPHFLNSADQIKISEMVFIHEMLLTQTLVSNHCCKLNSMSNNSCVCLVIARWKLLNTNGIQKPHFFVT